MTSTVSQKNPETVVSCTPETIYDPHATAKLSGCYAIHCAEAKYYALFEPTRQILTFPGRSTAKVELSFSTSRLLELLINKADTIVSRQEILTYAWPGRIVTQSSLNQAVSSIREQLGDETAKEIVQTMPRRGYQFNSRFLVLTKELPGHAEETQVDDPPWLPQQAPSQPTSMRSRSAKPDWFKTRSLMFFLLVIFLFFSLVYRMNWTLLLQPGLSSSSQQSDNKDLFYTAIDEAQLLSLQTEIAPLRQRLLDLSDEPGTLLFNRMYSFYDVICISKNSHISYIFVHKSQLPSLTDEQLLGCLQ